LGERGPAFHAAKSGQAHKNVAIPPVTTTLRRKGLVQQLHFSPHDLGRERNVHGLAADVTIPFGDLVRQVELIAEDGGYDLADSTVILVRVVRRGRDDDIGYERSCDLF